MRKAPLLALLVVGALVALVPATAADGDAEFWVTSGVPIRISGNLVHDAPAGLFVAEGADGTIALRVDHAGATYVLRTITTHSLIGPSGEAVPVDQTIAEATGAFAAGTLVLGARGEDFLLSAAAGAISLTSESVSAAPKDVWSQANAELTVTIVEERVGPAVPSVSADATPVVTDAMLIREGTTVLRSHAAEATGSVSRILLSDGAVAQGGEFLAAVGRSDMRPGGVYAGDGAWVGPGEHLEERTVWAVAELSDARFVASSQAAPMSVAASAWHLELDGLMLLPWAEGYIWSDGTTTRLEGQQTLLGGKVLWTPIATDVSSAPEVRMIGQGVLTVLHVGGLPSPVSAEDAAVLAGGAVAAGAAAVAVVWYWPLLKWLASGAIAPLYARVAKEHVLDHKGRETVYELIKAEPGVSTNQLAKSVDFGWSTLTYHLRVLERNEAVVSVRDGRYKRFFDRKSGRFSNGRKNVIAALRNPTTLAIAKHILLFPGSSQKEVGEAFHLAPSSVHWHVERMSEVGLVSPIRDRHHVRYHPGEAWSHIEAKDVGIEPELVAKATIAHPAPASTLPSSSPTTVV